VGFSSRGNVRRSRQIYCTISVRFTDRTSPALDPATTSVYVPPGVTAVVAAGTVTSGIVRLVAHPAVATSNSAVAAHLRRRRSARPNGSSIASHTSRSFHGSLGGSTVPTNCPVATVTDTLVLPPKAALTGFTVQVAFAGIPAQVNATLPGSPAAEVSNSA